MQTYIALDFALQSQEQYKFFLKVAQAGGWTWDLFDFRLFSLSIAEP